MKHLGQGPDVAETPRTWEFDHVTFWAPRGMDVMLSGVIIRNLAGDVIYSNMFSSTLWIRRGTFYLVRVEPPVTTDDADGVEWVEA